MRKLASALALSLLAPTLLLAAPTGPFTGKSEEEIVAVIDDAVARKKASSALTAALVKALGDDTAGIRVRERAAWALGELNVKSATPALIKAADHKGLLIRSAAITSLTRLRAPSALPVLIKVASTDPILPLRQRAVIALSAFRSDKAIDPLVKLSSDPSPEVRGAAALAMAGMQSKKNDFSEILKEMTADENAYVKERAQKGLEIVKGKPSNVLTELKSGDADIRFVTAVYFDGRAGSRELDALKDAWNTESDDDVRDQLSRTIVTTKKKIQAEKERKELEAKEKAAREAAGTAGGTKKGS